MEKLKINLVNCYGIGSLQHEFDFTKFNSQLIYASNGVMKTSFANTFKDIESKTTPLDRLHGKPSTYNVLVDNSPIQSDQVCVVKSFDDIDTKMSQSKLLVDQDSKIKYDNLYNQIHIEKEKLLADLNKDSGIKKNDLEATLLKDFALLDFFEILQGFVDGKYDRGNFDIKYTDIFNKDVIEFLSLPNVKKHIVNYFETYNKLIEESTIYKAGIFNTTKADNIQSSLKKENFFHANHIVKLNGVDTEFTSDSQMEKFLLEQKRVILENDDLKKIEAKIKKVAVHKFKELLETETILQELTDLDSFKMKLWSSYFEKHNINIQFLLNTYNTNLGQLKEIENKAYLQETKWDIVIKEFNERFFVPFEAEIENKASSILGKAIPTIVFRFKDVETGNEVVKHNEEFKGDKILSQGEKRAMYLLNVIFKIEAFKSSGNKVLFIIDDIADSFDYKNKYAILKYLQDISETDNFYQIILTHNFDFYRTIQSRIFKSKKWEHSYKADRNLNDIELMPFGNKEHTNPFEEWKNNLSQQSKLIATIPFVRNIIEYKDGNKCDNYIKLTSLLHIKPETKNISIGDIIPIFESVIDSSKLEEFDSNIKMYDVIFDEVNEILNNHVSGVNLDKKVILSIGIRLKAEEFVWGKISDQSLIKNSQTAKLTNRFIKEFGSELETIKILDKVNLITPENIHLNSFMFEPILDLSMDHLIQLYNEVIRLN